MTAALMKLRRKLKLPRFIQQIICLITTVPEPRIALNASPVRALAESLIIGLLVLLPLLLAFVQADISQAASSDVVASFYFCLFYAAMSAIIVYSMRLRLPPGKLIARIWRDLVLFVFVAAILTTVFLTLLLFIPGKAASFVFSNIEVTSDTLLVFTLIINIVFWAGIFFTCRIVFSMLLFVEIRRRHYLSWSLTSAQISVIIVTLFFFGIADKAHKWSEVDPGWGLDLKLISPVIIKADFFFRFLGETFYSTSFQLILILPPCAVFSYFITRWVTRRIENLVTASSAVRGGNYTARTTVEGDDEISRLQTDFNATAAELEHVVGALQAERAKLRLEQEKSERLLLNILPEPIASRLKERSEAIAESFTETTVLFADIVDFTKLSARLTPQELVAWLNEVFSAFDALAEKHGLEKIKTIGDAYMVAGGLPTPRADHAQAVAEMALAMQAEIARRSTPDGQPMRMRIGINTGEVVAGVIGTKKFIYDLWGDAVNTASRMESHGIGGCIQVTSSTYAVLRDVYEFEERGVIQIKGKGEMQTWLLNGRKAIAA